MHAVHALVGCSFNRKHVLLAAVVNETRCLFIFPSSPQPCKMDRSMQQYTHISRLFSVFCAHAQERTTRAMCDVGRNFRGATTVGLVVGGGAIQQQRRQRRQLGVLIQEARCLAYPYHLPALNTAKTYPSAGLYFCMRSVFVVAQLLLLCAVLTGRSAMCATCDNVET